LHRGSTPGGIRKGNAGGILVLVLLLVLVAGFEDEDDDEDDYEITGRGV